MYKGLHGSVSSEKNEEMMLLKFQIMNIFKEFILPMQPLAY